uniref:RNA-directed RNA polymerase n=1 Tax=Tolypocladium cylindrosporum virus 2 TaxID=939924 RepID=E7BBP8_9VIRU|nr:RNA dependent RNA polymerase [Tolypocladium cylindrosporum virus 2]
MAIKFSTASAFSEQKATMGASYIGEPSGAGTLLMPNERERIGVGKLHMHAVVLPVLCGKSLMCHKFSGYDIDDIVVNEEAFKCDQEWEEMIDARERGYFGGDNSGYLTSNRIMLRRARRFFDLFVGDGNAPVLYVQTAEMAEALGAEIIYVGSVARGVAAATPRYQALSDEEQRLMLKLLIEQDNANEVYCARHGLQYDGISNGYEVQAQRVSERLRRCGLNALTSASQDALDRLYLETSFRGRLNQSCAIACNAELTGWVRAVAAREAQVLVGAALPQGAGQVHNHVRWARVIHALEQHALAVVPGPKPVRTRWSEKFPYGPGNAKFALAKIGDFLESVSERDYQNGYAWFRQLLNRDDCSYERALCHLIMGDVWCYVAPELKPLVESLRIGGLAPLVFAEVCKGIHTLVRDTKSMLGAALNTHGLALCTYFDCLAGRYFGEGDIEKEIHDRTVSLEPRHFIMPDGSKSEAEFDMRFKNAVADVLHSTLVDGGARILRASKITKSFDTFLEHRKAWVRPGSVTGSPKTDVYIKVVGDREMGIREVADDLHMMGTYVLSRVRLNKAATFEFEKFPELVRDCIGDYVPNSFTRHFIKNEIAKVKGRALFPSHVVHYIVGTYVLQLLMKAAPIEHARLIPDEATPRDEHWMWMEARDFTVGLMLDYDDFNESHEIRDMQMIINSLKGVYRRAGALSPDLSAMIDWVVEAYEKMVFEFDGKQYHFLHGMLSGQAPTSMINTVINTANKRVIREQIFALFGESVMTKRTSGGDDVAAETYDVFQAAMIVKVGEMMGFAFSTHKQLISTSDYEFFRLFVSAEGVYGSLPRVLGSLCSGQWSNSVKAKFIDPASKLNSVVEMARKAARRAKGNITFLEKLCNAAFRKWATFGEHELVDGYVHGPRNKGGLGVPMADGSIYDIEPIPVDDTPPVELLGLPDSASRVVAKEQISDAKGIVGESGVVAEDQLAQKMAGQVFRGNIAAMEGAMVGQILSDARVPPTVVNITGVKSIRREHYDRHGHDVHVFRRDYARLKHRTDALKNAGARYDALAAAVKPGYRRRLAHVVGLTYAVDGDLLYYWKENLTLFGCGTYLLTEDYYNAVQLMALVTAPGYSDNEISERLAYYATALANSNMMNY